MAGAYIGGAYFFTSSTSFANPAVTLARTLSNTFAGIDPGSVPGFVVAQIVGAALAIGLVRVLYPAIAEVAPDVIVPHPAPEGAPVVPAGGPGTAVGAQLSQASAPGTDSHT